MFFYYLAEFMPKNLSFVKYVEEMPSGNGLFSVFITAFLRLKRFRRSDFTLNHLQILPNFRFLIFDLIWPSISLYDLKSLYLNWTVTDFWIMVFGTCENFDRRIKMMGPLRDRSHQFWITSESQDQKSKIKLFIFEKLKSTLKIHV